MVLARTGKRDCIQRLKPKGRPDRLARGIDDGFCSRRLDREGDLPIMAKVRGDEDRRGVYGSLKNPGRGLDTVASAAEQAINYAGNIPSVAELIRTTGNDKARTGGKALRSTPSSAGP